MALTLPILPPFPSRPDDPILCSFLFCLSRNGPATRPVSNRLLCFYQTISEVVSVEGAVAAAVAAAQQQQLEQHTAAPAAHICRASHLSRRRAGCRQGCIMHRNGPCSLAWYAVSARNIMNNTIIIYNDPRTLYFCPKRNCEQIRDVWLASSGTVVAAWNSVRLVNARRGPGLLDFEGSGLPISVAAWPASAKRGWLGMGRLVPPRKYTYIGVLLQEMPGTVCAWWTRDGGRVSLTSRGRGCRFPSRLGRHRPREGGWGWGAWCLHENIYIGVLLQET